MLKANVYNTSGEKSGTISLSDKIFAAPVNSPLVAQAIRVYLSNQRHSHAKTKTRGEVDGSGRKIYRQKGTGGARHGDRYAPIFVGGGVAHGPCGEENWHLKMSQKMRRQALFSSLTSQFKNGHILIIDGLEKIAPKTKEMAQVITNNQKNWPQGKASKKLRAVTLVLPQPLKNVLQSARNLNKVQSVLANQLHPYQVLKAPYLILMKPSVAVLEKTFCPTAKS